MPVDWSKYPDDWKEIANGVKEATGWKCQVCGKQCHRPGRMLDGVLHDAFPEVQHAS